ncbi:MAG: cell division protein ZapD [Betaproteobacteria bacterium]|nr:cell division protein ZapD [Betaproteobacteria bacterium]
MISYEYPLSERVRTLLRFEDLYERVEYFLAKPDAHEHHAALVSVFEILEVASRADLKSDLLQELERQKHVLESLRENPDVSEAALNDILARVDQSSSQLFQASGKVGQELRDNDWLMSIKQRTSIPGGVCEFDLPSYHFWLQQNSEQRRHDLQQWLMPFTPIREAVVVVLRLLRESSKSTTLVARQGLYQQMMAGRVAQMLRIRLSRNYQCVPEISANKYALNIRFTSADGGQRPKVVDTDVEFELTFCNL